jgi:uncharacterized RDD family membrane protein YckC
MDTTVTVDTPEGVEITLHVAGPIVRAMAWLIDFALRAVIYVVIMILSMVSLPSFSEAGLMFGVISIIGFLLEWLYPALFEGFTGSTPGKKWVGLKVLQDDGTPLTFPSAIIRNFLRAVDFLPLMYVTGLVAMNNNSRFQRLGDLAAGSLVVYLPESLATESVEEVQSQPVPATLALDDRLTVVSFASRSTGLSGARQIELANTLEPVTGQQGEMAVNTLKAWANWVVRGQVDTAVSKKAGRC